MFIVVRRNINIVYDKNKKKNENKSDLIFKRCERNLFFFFCSVIFCYCYCYCLIDGHISKERKKERKKEEEKQTNMEKTKFGGEKRRRAKEIEKKEKHQIAYVGQRVISFFFFFLFFRVFLFFFSLFV